MNKLDRLQALLFSLLFDDLDHKSVMLCGGIKPNKEVHGGHPLSIPQS